MGDGHGLQLALPRCSPASRASHLMGDQVNYDFVCAAGVWNRSGCEATTAQPERYLAPLWFERLGQLQLADGLQSHMKKMLGGREVGIGKIGPGFVRVAVGSWH